MTRSWWKRAASVGLLLSAFSLPVWGGNHPKDKVGDHDRDHDRDDPKKIHKDSMPEGGDFYTYVVLSGLVIVGGVWVAYKRSSNRSLSKS
jgi:hypothetical protein